MRITLEMIEAAHGPEAEAAALMTDRRPFREITSAPRDIPVEVLHRSSETVTLARWDSGVHAWIRVGDPDCRPLRRVIAWRLVR